MDCTFLGNAGVLLSSGGESLLVDAPNDLHTDFDAFAECEQEKLLQGQAPYGKVAGILFTHRHADHYDKRRVRAVQERRPGILVFAPNGQTPETGSFRCGDFFVRYRTVQHSGDEFRDVVHRVYTVSDGAHKIYLTGDSDWLSAVHGEVLASEDPDAAVWNPNFVTHSEGRDLMRKCRQNLICHLPVNCSDAFGFGRKCRSSREKYCGDISSVILADRIPMTVSLC